MQKSLQWPGKRIENSSRFFQAPGSIRYIDEDGVLSLYSIAPDHHRFCILKCDTNTVYRFAGNSLSDILCIKPISK
jgi:hypothetical protein